MSGVKDYLGIDFIDVLIHGVVTVALMAMVDMTRGPEPMYPTIVATSFVLFGVRRHFALKRRGDRGLTTGEMAAERIADLEARVVDLESAQTRILELEERVDFTERMLASDRAPGMIAPPEG
jgi:hypothetical protein